MNSTVKALRGATRAASGSREANGGLFFLVNVDAETSFVMKKEHFHQDCVNIVVCLWRMMLTVLYLQGQGRD